MSRLVTVAFAQNCYVTIAKEWTSAIYVIISIALNVQKEDSKGAVYVGLSYARNVHILGIALDAIKTFVTTTASQDTIALPAERVSAQIARIHFGKRVNTAMPISVTNAMT